MKTTKRSPAGLVVLGIGLTVFACGSDSVAMMGDAMVDAGHVLVDAGALVTDAGDAMTSDAAAQAPQVFTGACTEQLSGSWYAEASAPGVVASEVTSVRAMLCDLEGSDPAAGGLECWSNGSAYVGDGRLRVRCGLGDPATTGFRYRSVRFIVR